LRVKYNSDETYAVTLEDECSLLIKEIIKNIEVLLAFEIVCFDDFLTNALFSETKYII
jgi:hypothetical protein